MVGVASKAFEGMVKLDCTYISNGRRTGEEGTIGSQTTQDKSFHHPPLITAYLEKSLLQSPLVCNDLCERRVYPQHPQRQQSTPFYPLLLQRRLADNDVCESKRILQHRPTQTL